MRNSFARFITEKTLEDKSIKLIVGDIGLEFLMISEKNILKIS